MDFSRFWFYFEWLLFCVGENGKKEGALVLFSKVEWLLILRKVANGYFWDVDY